ncbi:histidinol-phosphate transaminase [Schaalia suimastitidis]|uniref:histidinol-phosphate transaminase n=1 Tax=Schaalia suimastitidis TaxID=121163 RepID=UPI0003F985AB|nr:histidinol-phosphate transaminase [Schaalia suimastitidis]
MTLPVRLRPEALTIPRYVPGRAVPGAAKLSSNEMPSRPSPSAIEAASAAIASAHRYPDMAAHQLRDAIATHYRLDVEQICVGTGSSAVLLAALSAVCQPGAEVIFPWRSFESYPIAVPTSHATPVPIALRPDGSHDLDAMLAAVNEATAALILCTPNNPTGVALTYTQVADVAARLPDHVLLIVDEAYMEFATAPEVTTAVPLIATHPNIMVMRTFSKAYALAGLRVGYGMGHADLIGAMQALSVPFGVSGPAQAGALAALNDQAYMCAAVAEVVAERERIVTRLHDMDVLLPETQANFYWLPTFGRDFVDSCAAEGLIIRPFPEGVRVTVGSAEHNDRLLTLVQCYLELRRSTQPRRHR